jgi:pyruvate dehydrogenase E2 component (dihydrolipoamide acetyltransferase)
MTTTAVEVPMPRLSDSMEQGTIVSWLLADGDEVKRGQELVEIETDKATMAFEAPADGVLRTLAVPGDTLPVGAPIAVLGDGSVSEAATSPAPAAEPGANGRALSASPVAKRLAAKLGVALAEIAGSGPRGRIVKADVLAAAAEGGAPAAAAASTPAADAVATVADASGTTAAAAPAAGESTGRGTAQRQPLTRTQQIVARRMAESRATVPDFSVSAEVDMTAALALRAELSGLDPAPTVNDFVVAATARTLRAHPHLNASFDGDAYLLHGRVNVGIAVALDHELYVPTLFDADAKPLATLAAEARGLVARTRSGAITPPELSGGTFTVSNLGMFGISSFEPIVNVPQAAILAVGGTRAGGAMRVTLVSDHRIVYGAHAATFLRDLRALLEQPLRILAT